MTVDVKELETASLTVGVYSSAGRQTAEVDLPVNVFGTEPNMAVMHQAYLRQLANARQGTAATKTRGQVSGGGAKPYRQKGTGRARHGSTREPSMVGGGTVFGPKPRSFRLDLPRKMRRLALRSALSVKAQEGKIKVLEGFDLERPSTSAVLDLLHSVGVEETALIVLGASNLMVQRSVSNLPWAKVILWSNLNLYDLFTHDQLLVQKGALESLWETFGAEDGSSFDVESATRAVTVEAEADDDADEQADVEEDADEKAEVREQPVAEASAATATEDAVDAEETGDDAAADPDEEDDK